MDITGFLLGSGFALLVLLLGWASQITSKNKETKDLERAFLKKADLKLKSEEYKKMINEVGSTDDSFTSLVNFLYSNKEENIEIFENIKNIKEDIVTLDKKYSWRFRLLLIMSMSLFISGTVSFFLSKNYKFWILVPNLIFVILVYCNLVNVHNIEKKYTKNISSVMEKL